MDRVQDGNARLTAANAAIGQATPCSPPSTRGDAGRPTQSCSRNACERASIASKPGRHRTRPPVPPPPPLSAQPAGAVPPAAAQSPAAAAQGGRSCPGAFPSSIAWRQEQA
jgi:hypothetical protein